MAKFKFKKNDTVVTHDNFVAIVVDMGEGEDGVNYYECKPASFPGIAREFPEDHLKPIELTWRWLWEEVRKTCSRDEFADNIIGRLMDEHESWEWDAVIPMSALSALN